MASVDELKTRYCTWMADLPDHITHVPLSDLAIPGSHDSFSAFLDPKKGVAVDLSGAIKFLGQCCCGAGMSVFKRWSVTQGLAIKDQLECGIRYFDLRVALKPGTIDFYFLHGLYGCKVLDTMADIKKFLTEHTKEVVILDFNHFHNMNDIAHAQLLNMLKDTFLEVMVIPTTRNEAGIATLNSLWQTRGRVYIFYHNDVIDGQGGFWPGYKIPSPWPNTNDISELIQFQSRAYKTGRRRPDGFFYVWHCVLTPRAGDVFRYLCGGSLEQSMVSQYSPAMVSWLRDKVAGPIAINICLGDFVESHNFISTVIDINFRTYRTKRISADIETSVVGDH